MGLFRGILLIALGVFALYEGFRMMQLHVVQRAWFAIVLGAVAIALGVWRMMRKEDARRR
jgi:hypothetical protein